MDFNSPAQDNIFDKAKIVGTPRTRIDGPLKTSGQAPYAYERHDVVEGQLAGFPLGSSIAKGRIRSMDTKAAEAAPGVVAVVTTLDMDEMPIPSGMHNTPLFGGNEIRHYDQAIAVVVAETFEQARAAAHLIKVDLDADRSGHFDLKEAWNSRGEGEVISERGDFHAAFAEAQVTLEETYTTPGHSHAMMEPHATVAHWDDGKLTVWTSNQMIGWARKALAKTFEMDPENIRVDSPYVGGGFGAKLFIRADVVLAALGARAAKRPVKLMLPRPMIMNNTTHRGATIQRIRIGATEDGKITAIGHESMSNSLPGGNGEDAVAPTRNFYAGDNRLLERHVAEMHLPESNAMRAPGETAGLMALEIAMDEMAEKLGIDPVEFRIINDSQVDPEDPDKPFSDRHFVECLRTGAEAFKWSPAEPGRLREGMWLVGQGVAGAYRGSPAMASGARVRLNPEGRVTVETDMTDIGTGAYTIIAQTAAETLGVPLEFVEVRLGDSDFPVSSGSGGQWGAASSTAGTYAACLALRQEVATRLGVNDHETLTFEAGKVSYAGKQVELGDIAREGEIVAEDTIRFGKFRKQQEVSTFGAHFAEVAVHVATGETRVRRMLSVCDSGRILNPLTARSQLIGAMVMGVGAALMEEIAVDRDKGFFANHDLAGYEVPVHADIPVQDVIFLETLDAAATPLKAKGVGELGLCGVPAAVANAIYNATGIRLRDYPMTLDKMLDRLPAL